ncbi:MAG: UDP-N-acetylmuramate dehydrogenase [Candidatus Parcubacteria bacterium]|jgi:UDP-N-acetylmuramate dehydrogenase|nr:UDP-N-acetylmuramate dehydrogenase [Candidatus Parcubacteria bacterium]
MEIKENIPLSSYTTFKIGGPARYFCIVADETELIEALEFAHGKKLPVFVLGGGSNILVSDEGFSGLVVKIEMKGISYRTDRAGKKGADAESCLVEAAAGEVWDEFVENTVSRGLYGLENLSAIPGTVGAAPVQNIGAYGAELSENIVSVRALDTATRSYVTLSPADCHFDYRDSIFKHRKGLYVITRVDFRLSKNGKVNVSYRDLQDYFAKRGASRPSLKEVRDAVIEVRANKLPDRKRWGTAGSYFKNPIVPLERFIGLKKKYGELPGYVEPDGRIKLSLGWILDKICRVKGFSVGHASTYEKQALVVVAHPGATAADVIGLSHELTKRVKDATGVDVEGEVEWVN